MVRILIRLRPSAMAAGSCSWDMAAGHSSPEDWDEDPRTSWDWDDVDFRLFVNTMAGKRYEISNLDGTDTVGCLKVLLRYTMVPKPRERLMRLSFGNIVLEDTKRLCEYSIYQGSELNLVMLPPCYPWCTDGSRSRSRSPKRSWRVREFLMRLDRCREV
jgi:hypothetical protein